MLFTGFTVQVKECRIIKQGRDRNKLFPHLPAEQKVLDRTLLMPIEWMEKQRPRYAVIFLFSLMMMVITHTHTHTALKT